MILMGLPTFLVLLVALGVVLLWIDALFIGGALMSGIVHGAAGMMTSPFGWVLIVVLVVILLIGFGMLFGQR